MNIWGIGNTRNITITDLWDLLSDPENPTRLSFVKIELTRDAGDTWETIEANYANATGVYSWEVTGPASNLCYIRISDPSDAENSDIGSLFGIGAVESVNMSAFILKVKTDNAGTSGPTQFTLPRTPYFAANYRIEWGDGTAENVTATTTITHTYASAGTYDIAITDITPGGFAGLYQVNAADQLKILEVVQWGTVRWLSMLNAFYGCIDMVITATDHATAVFTYAEDWSSAFYLCDEIGPRFPAIPFTGALNLSYTFRGCNGIQYIDAGNTETVTNFHETLVETNGLIEVPLWDTSNGVNFEWFANGNSELVTVPNISFAKGVLCKYAFATNPKLVNFAPSSFPEATDMTGFFYGSPLVQLNNAFDMPKVTNLLNTFPSGAFTTDAYSGTLQNLALNNTTANLTLDVGTSKYHHTSKVYRDALIARGWTIVDGGMVRDYAISPIKWLDETKYVAVALTEANNSIYDTDFIMSISEASTGVDAIFDIAKSDGSDIVAIAPDGTKLNIYKQLFDAVNRKLTFKISCPAAKFTDYAYLYLQFGSSTVSEAGSITVIPSLVNYWPMQDSLADIKSGDTMVPVAGSALSYVTGKLQKSLKFENALTSFGGPANNRYQSTNFTASCWFKVPIVANLDPTAAGIIGCSYSASKSGFDIECRPEGYVGIRAGNGSTFYNGYTAIGTLKDNSWNHVVFTSDGTTVKFYYNGKLILTQTKSLVWGNGVPFAIGKLFYNYNANYLLGNGAEIDDVKIQNAVLTAVDIATNFEIESKFYNNGALTVGAVKSVGGSRAQRFFKVY